MGVIDDLYFSLICGYFSFLIYIFGLALTLEHNQVLKNPLRKLSLINIFPQKLLNVVSK